MISHKHKCIFIHVPKAAGTSIERVFLEDLDLDMDNRHALLLGASTNISLGPRRISHLLAREYVSGHFISQELFESYFKFAFVRNPISRIYSTYKFLNFDRYVDFDTFVSKKIDRLSEDKMYGFFMKPAYDYLFDENGKCLVDYIGKFESISVDFTNIISNINFFSKNIELKHYNKLSNKGDSIVKRTLVNMREKLRVQNDPKRLTSSSKDKIFQKYELDFTHFNYEYEW
ncbi:sulfotransferase family 2 domain-containing protein [Algoriphagus sp. PAP.12]|uniref:sulfotransferase family 2 domain-containing protein n=1 Tax=Algoriphagus sp. PAP.12 TaxID=2996678 RepID=UPI00227C3AEE|nr:sulfotransferase family 2 domain-containing protein [Algoriphagus sp. PAP.12]